MSDPKDFLSRWSKRKLEAGEAQDAAPAEEKAVPPAEARKNEPSAPAAAAPVPAFDVTTLPSLESIGAHSDIRAFLQRGVPPGLTRAALRRAWSADPAIRDFVGLSENSWDFNAPASVPGFGPLDASEVRRLAAQLFGEPGESATGEALPASRSEGGRVASAEEKDKQADVISSPQQPKPDDAMQHQRRDDEADSVPVQRRHGGALPE